MILTNCAACAAPLALDAPRCIRCHTRYCNKTYASSLIHLQRYAEARSLLRRTIPVARRVLGESDHLLFRMRWVYGEALCRDDRATRCDVREGVTTLEEIERTARRRLGSAHPLITMAEAALQHVRAKLRAREMLLGGRT